jgi:hypothetical protein
MSQNLLLPVGRQDGSQLSPTAFATLRREGEEIAETTIAHIAPLGWEHINLIGK